MILTISSWLAVILLSCGYFRQVWYIHKHKEVRDLSLTGYICLCVGFVIMLITAINEGSVIFTVKQLATLIPCAIIVYQIIIHKDDKWRD